MKKLIAVFTSLVLVVGLMPLPAFAGMAPTDTAGGLAPGAAPGIVGDAAGQDDERGMYAAAVVASGICGKDGYNLTWTLDGEGVLTISGKGPMRDFSSSDEAPWFDSRSSIKAVSIGDGVESVGRRAFELCSKLASVEMPGSVMTIGDQAFNGCASLKSVVIPGGVQAIRLDVFSGCEKLESVTISAGVQVIDPQAFYGCRSLEKVSIPSTVTSIGNLAFDNCPKLVSGNSICGEIYYGGSQWQWDGITKNNCGIPDGESEKQKIRYMPGVCVSVSPDGSGSVIGAGTYSLETSQWLYRAQATPAKGYRLVSWTQGGEILGDQRCCTIAFSGDRAPEVPLTANFEAGVGGVCGDNLTWRLDDERVLAISGTGEMSVEETDWKHLGLNHEVGIREIQIDLGVTSIVIKAFKDYSSLESAKIPESVTSIGASAFENCSSLSAIAYGGSRSQWSGVSKGDGWDKNTYEGKTVTYAKWDVAASASPEAGGTVDGAGTYAKSPATTATLEASPKIGYAFVGWTKDGVDGVVSTDNPYSFTAEEDAAYVANFAKAIPAFSVEGKTYDGEVYKPEPTIKDGETTLAKNTDYTINYQKKDDKGNWVNEFSPKNAGDYQVVATGMGDYAGATGYGEFTIDKRPITIGSYSTSFRYDGSAHQEPIIGVEEGNLATGDELVGEATGSVTNVADGEGPENQENNPFYYKIMRNGTDVTNNYAITTEIGYLGIYPAHIEILVEDASVQYNGHEQYGSRNHTVNWKTGDLSSKMTTSLDANNGENYHPSFGTKVGEYENALFGDEHGPTGAMTAFNVGIRVLLNKDNGETEDVTANFTVDSASGGKLTITQSSTPITIKSNDVSKPYDGNRVEPTYTVTYGNETATVDETGKVFTLPTGDKVTITDTAKDAVTDGESAQATFTYELENADQYVEGNVTTEVGTLTVVPHEVSVSVENTDVKYDGSEHLGSTTVTFDGVAKGQTATITYGPAKGTKAGTYTGSYGNDFKVMSGGKDVTGNYKLTTKTPGKLTIAPKPVTITVAGASKVEGEADPAFTGTVEGLVADGDLGKVAYKRTNSDEAPGTYKGVITAAYTANANYDVTVKNGDFTIEGKEKPYDGDLSDVAGYVESVKASMPDLDPDSWYMGGDGTRGGYFPGTDVLYLDYTLARGLMGGYTDKDGEVYAFGPNDPLKRAEAVTTLYRMANKDATATTDPAKYEANRSGLPDVEDRAYYTAAVNWAVENGIVIGYTDESGKPYAFGPDDPLLREQVATITWRWCTSDAVGMAQPTEKAADIYDDAASISEWALTGVAFCHEKGIMTGFGGTRDFGPALTTERCEMSKVVAVADRLVRIKLASGAVQSVFGS